MLLSLTRLDGSSTLLPKGRQALSATLAAYEAGQTGFLDLVDAQRILLEFELSYQRALTDGLVQKATIAMLAGILPEELVIDRTLDTRAALQKGP